MAQGKRSVKDDISPEAAEKAKKQRMLNAAILAAVLLLSAVLPPAYKVFAPFLFVIPFILSVLHKIRQAGVNLPNPPEDQTHYPPVPNRIPSPEPYAYKPKDPKDPRRYKPIG